jgi:hypothetical protein
VSKQLVPIDRPALKGLHSAVYIAIVGLAVWFVLSVWVLFGTQSHDSVDIGVITVFFIMAVGIPSAIWLTWRNHPEASSTGGAQHYPPPSLRQWSSGDFETWTGRQKASQAIIEILLPIAAVAIGITVFGLVFDLTAHGVL